MLNALSGVFLRATLAKRSPETTFSGQPTLFSRRKFSLLRAGFSLPFPPPFSISLSLIFDNFALAGTRLSFDISSIVFLY